MNNRNMTGSYTGQREKKRDKINKNLTSFTTMNEFRRRLQTFGLTHLLKAEYHSDLNAGV